MGCPPDLDTVLQHRHSTCTQYEGPRLPSEKPHAQYEGSPLYLQRSPMLSMKALVYLQISPMPSMKVLLSTFREAPWRAVTMAVQVSWLFLNNVYSNTQTTRILQHGFVRLAHLFEYGTITMTSLHRGVHFYCISIVTPLHQLTSSLHHCNYTIIC